MAWLRSLSAVLVVTLLAAVVVAEAPSPAPYAVGLGRALGEFGPLEKPQDAQETYLKALEALRSGGGGVLVVPAEAWKTLKTLPSQQGLIRTPEAPTETKQWKTGAGVTIVTADALQTIVEVPPLTGLKIERQFRLDAGDSVPIGAPIP
jgi:hypothetical protein